MKVKDFMTQDINTIKEWSKTAKAGTLLTVFLYCHNNFNPINYDFADKYYAMRQIIEERMDAERAKFN